MALSTYLLAAAAGVGLLLLGTQVLPGRVTVTRSATVPAQPGAILARLSSTEGFQTINPYRNTTPDLKIEAFGPAAGVGSGFRFDGGGTKGTQTVSALDDTRIVYAIDLGAMGKPVQTVTVLPAEKGSAVTWTMEADLGRNPIARVMGLFMEGMVGPTLEQGLANLSKIEAL